MRYPDYVQKAIERLKAFDRMLAERAKPTDWRSAEEVFDWWMENDVLPGQMRMEEFLEMHI